MPLSEQEQRLLDEMERNLMRNDADVVSAPSGARSLSYRNLVYGTVLVLVGIGGLIAGVSIPLIVLGVAGFAVMLGGVILAATPARGSKTAASADRPTKKSAPAASSSFMDRMNDRWDKRQGDR